MYKKAIYIEHLGTLANILTNKEITQTEHIIVDGYINSVDVETLHKMVNENSLVHIDLHKAETAKRFSYSFCDNTKIQSFFFPKNLHDVSPKAFYYATSLSYIYLPDSVSVIGIDAFRNTKLKVLHIPQSVTEIKRSAFANTPIEYLYLTGGNVIESKAFADCKNLKEIRCTQTTPPRITTDTFLGVDKTCLLVLPPYSKKSYETAIGWSAFTNMVEENTLDIQIDNDQSADTNMQDATLQKNKWGCILFIGLILLFIMSMVLLLSQSISI